MTGESSPLPPGWHELSLGELLAPLPDGRTLHHGWSPQCEKAAAAHNEWAVLKTTAIQDGRFAPEHNKRLPSKLKPRPALEVQSGDLLITCAGPRSRCGVPCLVRFTRSKLILSGKMYRFRVPDDAIDPAFIEACLRTPAAQAAIDAMKTGISDSGLNLTHDRFRRLMVRVAPLNEQRRIVAKIEELFSDLDAGVAALVRVRANLKRYRAAVLKAAVEGRLTEAWRRQNAAAEPADRLLARILGERRTKWNGRAKYTPPDGHRAANLPTLPHDWAWATVEQLADVQGGIQKQPKRAPRHHAYPYLRVANVHRDRLDLSDIHKLELFGNELEKLRLVAGDLLIVEGNGSKTEIGRSAIWTGAIEDCVHQNHIIRVRVLAGTPKYLNIYWNSPQGNGRVMAEAASTSGLYTLSVTKVSRLPVPMPPADEQDQIVAEVERRLSVVEAVESEVEHGLRRAARLQQAILKRAFEGKLVPQDPSDQPADAVLARLRQDAPALTTPAKRLVRRRRTTA